MNGDVTHLGCKKSDFEIQTSNVTTNALGTGTGSVTNFTNGATSVSTFFYPNRKIINAYICQTKKSILYHNEDDIGYGIATASAVGRVVKINSATIQFTPISATLYGLTLNENLKLKFYMSINLGINSSLFSSESKTPILTGTVINGNIEFDPFYITTDDNYYVIDGTYTIANFTILDITMQ